MFIKTETVERGMWGIRRKAYLSLTPKMYSEIHGFHTWEVYLNESLCELDLMGHKAENKLWSLIFGSWFSLQEFHPGKRFNSNTKNSAKFISISVGKLKFWFKGWVLPREKSPFKNHLFVPPAGLVLGWSSQVSCSLISGVSACKPFDFSFFNCAGWRCFTERRRDHLH